MNLYVIGDIHAQADKMWRILTEAGLADDDHLPTDKLLTGDVRVVFLGDLGPRQEPRTLRHPDQCPALR